jgi:hypothetical protein
MLLVYNYYLHQSAQVCTAILTVNSSATSKFCSAVLPIVHTSASTYLSTSLAKHCTYFWTAQNITIAWAALTQAVPAFLNSFLFLLLSYSLVFALHLCAKRNNINEREKYMIIIIAHILGTEL